MLVGDVNTEESEPWLSLFLHEYSSKKMANTCIKNAVNPSCIDLSLTNKPLSFQITVAVSIELSDFYKVVITIMKMSFMKHSPIERHYEGLQTF